MCLQVPCAAKGGVVTKVAAYRATGGGWVRLVFNNINGSPLQKVELSKVSPGQGGRFAASTQQPAPQRLAD